MPSYRKRAAYTCVCDYYLLVVGQILTPDISIRTSDMWFAEKRLV